MGGNRRNAFIALTVVAALVGTDLVGMGGSASAAFGVTGTRPSRAYVPELAATQRLSGRLDTSPLERAAVEPVGATAALPSPISFAVPENTPADAADFPGGDANNEISFPMVATGDLNGDDIADLVAAFFPNCCGANGGVAVMLGLGDGTFGEPAPFSIGGTGANRVMGVGLGDFDEDGDLDVFGTVPQRSEYDVWLNDGSGTLGAPVFTPLTTKPGDDLKVADLDGDGHLDVVAGGSQDGSITTFYGRGDGTFADVVLATAQSTIFSLVVGDFDGTGALDIAWGGYLTQNITIAKATGPRTYETNTVTIPFQAASHLFAADLDGDGDTDLGMGGFQVTQNPLGSQCYSCITTVRGNGDGTFAVPAATDLAAYTTAPDNLYSDNTNQGWGPYSPDPVDVDGDSDIDLVFAYPDTNGLVFVARNDGAGKFDLDTYVGIADNSAARVGSYQINADLTNGTGQFVRGVAIDDFDDDGAIDLAVAGEEGGAFTANRGAVAIVRGDPDEPGDFLVPKVSAVPGRYAMVRGGFAFADWDDDGDDDVIAMRYDNRALLFENLGAGDFADAVDIQSSLRGTFACNRTASEQWLESGDFDGDGNDDILCRGADAAGQYTVNAWFGDGANGADLVTIATYTGAFSMPWFHVADIDGDGDDDILDSRITGCGPCQMTTVPFRNNGDRTFDELPTIAHGAVDQFQTPVVPVDVDSDDDLDLVARPGTGANPPLKVYRNDGAGAFADPTSSQPVVLGNRNLAVHTLLAGDLDTDGNQDLVIQKSWDYQSNIGVIHPGGLFVMLGNGDGTFDDPVQYTWGGGGGTYDGLVDLDVDGNLDLPVNPTHWGVEVMRGAGDGTFDPVQRFWTGSLWGYAARAHDVDGDRLPDIVKFRHDSFALSVLRNTSTGAVAGPDLGVTNVDAPDSATPGDTATVRATIANTGSRATGRWTDQVWLSADETLDANDRLLGAVEHSGAAAGGEYTVEVTAPLAPLVNGLHHVIVRADARGNLAESDEGNNRLSDSSGTELVIPALTDLAPLDLALANGPAYARVTVAAGDQVVVRANADVTIDAVNGKVPVPARDLIARDAPLVIPARDEDATWYLRVAPGDGVTEVQLTRAPLDFGIVDMSPAVIGNTGTSTVTISGDGFTDDAAVTIVHDATEVEATEVTLLDERHLLARFAIGRTAITTGRYDLRVDQGADTATLPAAINVVDDDTAGELEFDVSMPGTVRALGLERGVPITITFRNNGVNDIPAAYLFASSPDVQFDDPLVEGLDFAGTNMGVVTELADGPDGVLPPGAARRVEIRYLPGSGVWNVEVGVLEAGDGTVQTGIAEELDPYLSPVFADPGGSPVFARLLDDLNASSGTDCPCVKTGDYVKALNAAAREAQAFGVRLRSSDDRFEYLVERAFATTDGAVIGGRVHTPDDAGVDRVDVIATNSEGAAEVATTWYDGEFRIWRFPNSLASLRVDGHRPNPAISATAGSAPARQLDIEVERGSSINGVITRDAGGAPVGGATVEVYHGGSEHSVAYSSTDGDFALTGLASGPAIVVVSAPGLEPARSTITLADDAPTQHDAALRAGTTVRGVVSDAGGDPVAGATVAIATDPTLPAPTEAVTGADGSYAVSGISAGDWEAEVGADGFASVRQAFSASGSGIVEVDVELPIGGTIEGTVRRVSTGVPIADATITVFPADGPPVQATTDLVGRYSIADLAPGEATVNAAATESELVPGETAVAVVGGAVANGDIELGLASNVVGRVTDDAGAPVPGLLVHRIVAGAPVPAITDAEGRYSLPGVPPGEHEISFGGGAISRQVTVDGEGTDVDLDVVIDGATVTGRVVDRDGSPVGDLPVGLFVGDDLVTVASTDPAGAFRVVVLEGGTYAVRVAGDAFGSTETSLVSDGDADVDLGDLAPGGSSLAVDITVGGVSVDAVEAVLSHRGSSVGITAVGTSGRAQFENVEPGEYLLVAAAAGGASRQVEVTVAAGGSTRSVDLSVATTVVGRVTRDGEPVELATVVAAGTTNGSGSLAITDADGGYELEGLAPGAVRITAYDTASSDLAFAEADIAAGGGVVDLAITEVDALSVHVEADGVPEPAASAIALAGDALPGAAAVTDAAGDVMVPLASAGAVTVAVAAVGRTVAERTVADSATAGVVVIDVGPVLALGLSGDIPAPRAKPGPRSRAVPSTRDLADTGLGEAGAWLARHLSPVAWVGYFVYDSSLEPERQVDTEDKIRSNLQVLQHITQQPDREFCPGFTESLRKIESLRPIVELAYSGWQSAQKAYNIGWDDAVVRLPLGLAKIVASLALMVPAVGTLSGATFFTAGIVGGAAIALGLLDAFVSILTGGLDALPGAFQSVDGMLQAFNNIKDAIATGATQVGAGLTVWVEGLKAVAKNPTGANLIKFAQLAKELDLNPQGVTKLGKWVSRNLLWLNDKLPVAEMSAKVIGFIGATLDFITFSQGVSENIALLTAANDARKVGKRNYGEALQRLLAETNRAIDLSRKDCKKEPKFKLGRAYNLTGAIYVPMDPNDIVGPTGPGAAHWLAEDPKGLGYELHFENLGPGSLVIPPGRQPASIPAALVDVTLPVDPDLDIDTFELGDFGWADQTVDVPAGVQAWSERLGPFEEYGDVFVDVSAEVDRSARTVHWLIKAIDPETGDTPIDERGFLVPEDGAGNGQGWARFVVDANDGLVNRTKLTAQASIVFDTEAPLLTNVWSNSIDTGAPSAVVSRLPRTIQPGRFAVTWSGLDGGSGVASYDVYVSVDGGPLKVWRRATNQTSANYTGAKGHSYGFAVRATDAVGHRSAVPTSATTTTRVLVTNTTGTSTTTLPGFVGLDANRAVYAIGGASFHGAPASAPIASTVAAIGRTPSGKGYIVVTRRGHAYTYGDARYFGGIERIELAGAVTAVAVTPSGKGYWIVTADGGVFAKGDAAFRGSLAVRRVPGTIVDIGVTATGKGYYLVSSRGGVFTFGDAAFHGSLGARQLPSSTTGIDVVDGGRGYLLVTRVGAVYAFGSARSHGSVSGASSAVDVIVTAGGYWVVRSTGVVDHYGTARPVGRVAGVRVGSVVGAD